MRPLLHARVSDASQTLEHQCTHAEAAAFNINEVIADHGVSGVTKLADRPGERRLLDKVQAGDQVLVRRLDRLRRNYDDATATIRHMMNEDVVVKTVINGMVFDGFHHRPNPKGSPRRDDRVHGGDGAVTSRSDQSGVEGWHRIRQATTGDSIQRP